MANPISQGAQPKISNWRLPPFEEVKEVAWDLAGDVLDGALEMVPAGLFLSITNAVPGGLVTGAIFGGIYRVTAEVMDEISDALCKRIDSTPGNTYLKTAKWALSNILSIAATWALCNAVGMPITFTVAALLPATAALLPATVVALDIIIRLGHTFLVAPRSERNILTRFEDFKEYALDACGPLLSEGRIRECIGQRLDRVLNKWFIEPMMLTSAREDLRCGISNFPARGDVPFLC